MWPPADTSADAWRRQVDAVRSMTREARLRLADDMSTEVRRLAAAGAARRIGSPASRPRTPASRTGSPAIAEAGDRDHR